MMRRPVIYDGDMGGDDMWAIAMLLAHRDVFDVLAIASVFGNVSQPFATQNVMNFLHWLDCDDISVIQGADKPCDGMRPFGDDAYGADGVGGVALPKSPRKLNEVNIADWYAQILDAHPAPVTIFATGPITNLALLLEKYRSAKDKIAEIIWMGGGINPPGRDGKPVKLPNGDIRSGNIMPYAEFNAYQDPAAVNIVLKSGVRLVCMAMDATQNMVLTPPRQTKVMKLDKTYGPAFHRMLMVVADLDKKKFGLDGPSIHDPNVIIYALRPDLYTGREMPTLSFHENKPDSERRGQVQFTGTGANAFWLEGVTDKEKIFDLMLESLAATIGRASKNPKRLAG